MKLMFLLFVSMLCSSLVFSQSIPSSQVPAGVVKTLKRYFPSADNVEWEKKGANYQAAFEVKRTDHKALLEDKGKLIAYKKDIPAAHLPQAVRQVIRQQYKGYKIDDVQLIARNGNLYYEVDLDGPKDQKLVFTRDGKTDNSQGW
ncbi:hypothetical protein HHL16_09765 [Pseudoflavitalea sp. G-6-1-2]|uniref:PepSY-like domain-containing protein n=1 Tax=Pseudoflavitalea sp. G-6-1-2 TaxID=2728841 RepID=UPI00146AA06E|nr:PepSY-like domain-containing protein [Pseudoflavitalea sp. G-6-1-2]NML21161.1 hypothetical protein [Pseudoflavitalea sp. G-6-1-2]